MLDLCKSGIVPSMLKDILERIDARLDAVGLSESKAAKLAGLSDSAIRDMRRALKSGRRSAGISTRTINALAPILQTSPSWLLEAAGDEEGEGTVPLIGYVGAGAAARYYAESQGELDRVPALADSTKETVAVEIRGESLGPLFDRWLIYFDEVRRPITQDMIGHLCIVGLPDDRILVKQLKRSKTAGFYHLISNTEPPILDVEVMWAARVKHMVPR